MSTVMISSLWRQRANKNGLLMFGSGLTTSGLALIIAFLWPVSSAQALDEKPAATAASAALPGATSPTPAPATPTPAAALPTVQEITAAAKKSVVVVTFAGRDSDRQGLGAGWIVTADGLIATNLHVIGEARPIKVQLADGRSFDVKAVEAHDRHADLALLRIEARDLPALPIGDSDRAREGDPVIAIGNPLGLERSVVTGVLSGRRDIEGRPMLQIAMPIERGNSGGPLLDAQGRVLGLVTLKSLKSENLGFAMPTSALKPLIDKPNPIAMDKWLTIGVLDPAEWTMLPGGRWRQRAGRIQVEGRGGGLGGRCVALSTMPVPQWPYEVAVSVKFSPADGAAGLVFCADGGDKHYGFYPSNGELRLSRFEGADVYSWTVLDQVRSAKLRSDGWNTLKVRIEADRLRCYLNDELVIESTDRMFRDGRVGLCKFRQTEAEFKDLRVARELTTEQPSPEVLATLKSVVEGLPLESGPPTSAVAALEGLGPQAATLLEREAELAEQRIQRLRELARAVHDRQIRMELAKVTADPDEKIDLLRGALLIAAADNPDLQVDGYVQQVDRMARRIRETVPMRATPVERLQALSRELFEVQGYHGSRHDYDHRANSYLNEVIDDREGLPITLAVLYMELARRLELNVVGVGLPRHFVVRFEPVSGPTRLIDVFDRGAELSREAAVKKVVDAGVEWNDEYLVTASRRSILVRMLRNLFANARESEDLERMLRYIELVLVLTPDSAQDRFYRGVLCLQQRRLDQARADAEWLLEKQPDDLSRQALEDFARAVAREAAKAKP